MLLLIQEEFEDTKGVIRIKKSEKVQTTYSGIVSLDNKVVWILKPICFYNIEAAEVH
jgi:hypothetical protein